MRRAIVLLSFPSLLGLGACAGGAGPGEPAAPPSGAGLLSFDAEAPAGAKTWERPAWRVGQTFAVRIGERAKSEFRVAAIDGDAYVLDTGSGPQLRRDRDLGNLGEWARDGSPLRSLAPADMRYHWPLWVGKRWTCEFADRARGGAAVLMRASYVVEDVDTITVPAGTLETLRIVRTVRLVGADNVLSKTQVWWYAPSLGYEARQFAGDTVIELAERAAP